MNNFFYDGVQLAFFLIAILLRAEERLRKTTRCHSAMHCAVLKMKRGLTTLNEVFDDE